MHLLWGISDKLLRLRAGCNDSRYVHVGGLHRLERRDDCTDCNFRRSELDIFGHHSNRRKHLFRDGWLCVWNWQFYISAFVHCWRNHVHGYGVVCRRFQWYVFAIWREQREDRGGFSRLRRWVSRGIFYQLYAYVMTDLDCKKLQGRMRSICEGTSGLPPQMEEAYRKIWAGQSLVDVQAVVNFSCVHRGSAVRSVQCKLCGGGEIAADIHACQIHGECTIHAHGVRRDGPASDKLAVCNACEEIKTPASPSPVQSPAGPASAT